MATGEWKCRSCGASIVWAKTVNGNTIPIDADPKIGGNIILHDDGRAEYVDLFTARKVAGGARYVSHFATCPDAKKWRKKR